MYRRPLSHLSILMLPLLFAAPDVPAGGTIRNGKEIPNTDQKPNIALLLPKFGQVSCSRPKSASVFEKRGGGKSTVAISCTVPITSCGAIVDVSIYGNFNPKDGSVTFSAGVPQKMSFSNEEDAEDFLAHVENSALSWNGYAAAEQAAYDRIQMEINPALKPARAEGKAERPRLVFKPLAASQPTSQPTAAPAAR